MIKRVIVEAHLREVNVCVWAVRGENVQAEAASLDYQAKESLQ